MNYNPINGKREELDLKIDYYYEGSCSKTGADVRGNYCPECGENMLRISERTETFKSPESTSSGGFFGKIKNLFVDEEDDEDEM